MVKTTRTDTPDGLTMEQIDDMIRARQRQQRNEYNLRHPEKRAQNRLVSSVNYLRRLGWTVTPPEVLSNE